MKTYDNQNIFAKILRGEIPCDKVFESEFTLAFKDINPAKKVHIVVIPKGSYVDVNHFTEKATDKEIVDFFKSLNLISNQVGVADSGYRAITNLGKDGGQEVPHFHMHILGGEHVTLDIS